MIHHHTKTPRTVDLANGVDRCEDRFNASYWRFGDLQEKIWEQSRGESRFGQVIEQLQEMKRLGILAPVDEEWIGKAEARRAALE